MLDTRARTILTDLSFDSFTTALHYYHPCYHHLHYCSDQNPTEPQVSILLVSKPVKGLDEGHPSNILFKTHIYEIRIVPSEQFLKWAEKRQGFFGELQLYRKKRVEEEPNKVAYFEYGGEHKPYIQYSFEEDFSKSLPTWLIRMQWPVMKVNLKGEFCFRLQVYAKHGPNEYKRLFSKFSSGFVVVSKPNVLLNKINKNKVKKKDAMDIDDWKDYIPAEDDSRNKSFTRRTKTIKATTKKSPKTSPKKKQTTTTTASSTKKKKESKSESAPNPVQHHEDLALSRTKQRASLKDSRSLPFKKRITSVDDLLRDESESSQNMAVSPVPTNEHSADTPSKNTSRKRKRSSGLNHSIATHEDIESPQNKQFEYMQKVCEKIDETENQVVKRQRVGKDASQLPSPFPDDLPTPATSDTMLSKKSLFMSFAGTQSGGTHGEEGDWMRGPGPSSRSDAANDTTIGEATNGESEEGGELHRIAPNNDDNCPSNAVDPSSPSIFPVGSPINPEDFSIRAHSQQFSTGFSQNNLMSPSHFIVEDSTPLSMPVLRQSQKR